MPKNVTKYWSNFLLLSVLSSIIDHRRSMVFCIKLIKVGCSNVVFKRLDLLTLSYPTYICPSRGATLTTSSNSYADLNSIL